MPTINLPLAQGLTAADVLGRVCIAAVATGLNGTATPLPNAVAAPARPPYLSAPGGGGNGGRGLYVCTSVVNGRATLTNDGQVYVRQRVQQSADAIPPGRDIAFDLRDATPGAWVNESNNGGLTSNEFVPASIYIGQAVPATPGSQNARIVLNNVAYIAVQLYESQMASAAWVLGASSAGPPTALGCILASEPQGSITPSGFAPYGMLVAYTADTFRWGVKPGLPMNMSVACDPGNPPTYGVVWYDSEGRVTVRPADVPTDAIRWDIGTYVENAVASPAVKINFSVTGRWFPNLT